MLPWVDPARSNRSAETSAQPLPPQLSNSKKSPLKALRIVTLLLVALATVDFASASDRVRVKGYFRKDGTYVQPHYRTAPDGRFYNNWSTFGNVNPYTGEVGKKRYPTTTKPRDVVAPLTIPATPLLPSPGVARVSPRGAALPHMRVPSLPSPSMPHPVPRRAQISWTVLKHTKSRTAIS